MVRTYVTTMNKRVRLKWIRALESGKYKQTRGKLKSRNGSFCCLGLLCELYRKEHLRATWEPCVVPGGSPTFLGNSGTLPPEVTSWAGFVGRCTDNPSIATRGTQHISAVDANDDHKYSFKKIAKAVRENVKGV